MCAVEVKGIEITAPHLSARIYLAVSGYINNISAGQSVTTQIRFSENGAFCLHKMESEKGKYRLNSAVVKNRH